ncbi:hypothetical protein SAMN02910298_02223 [Pseudobutyrivibrio sp. YE44]|uniref:hypothetical protein n=1 Tax=Pseudobutyrivibrio sp. YE44 TaxID=1520802 RepID=UPI0008897B88|nr:hypothetical protein [Pseudobutyrivibrio sp. YE44]SDB44824.1 hypothetical protein SAMN02910298_02223 [Pseudobutyrivibrio sp. YE44]
MNIEELKARRKKLNSEFLETTAQFESTINETDRVRKITENSRSIITDLDEEFERKVELKGKDLNFIFVASGLLCVKWIMLQAIMPLSFDFKYSPENSDKRLNSAEMGAIDTDGKDIEGYKKTLERVKQNYKKAVEQLNNCTDETERQKLLKKIEDNKKRQNELNKVIKFLSENKSVSKKIRELETKRESYLSLCENDKSKYRSIKDILLKPVPYDAMKTKTSCKVPVALYGKNHHAYTMGHDPVLGWIFGTMNILSGTISYNLPNYPVYWVSSENIIDKKTNWISFIMTCINSTKDNPKRIGAATIRQGLHLMSDKYCKTGLPLSFAIKSADEAQELIEKGWNSEEIKKYIDKILNVIKKDVSIIAIQYILSFLINQIVYSIYMMMYEEADDGPIELYIVKAKRILSIANTISTSSNFAYVVITKKLCSLDIGGAIETIKLIIEDDKYRKKIKEEFIEKSFIDLINNSDSEYNWMLE